MTPAQALTLLAELDAIAYALNGIRDRVSLMVPPSDIPPDVMAIARTGRVAGAVHLWRETTGVGVIEGKRQIERALAAEAVK